jgi:NADH dehydrogenase FAD-containing subunit
MASAMATTWPSLKVTIADRQSVGAFAGPRAEAVIRSTLEDLAVRIEDDADVTAAENGYAQTRDGRRIEFHAIALCAGWRAPEFISTAGFDADSTGRVRVDGALRSMSHPEVYAAGDIAGPATDTGAPFRASVWAALVSGAHAANNIAREIRGREPKRLNFATWGQGVALGRGGVGFPTFPDDRQKLLLFRGRSAYALRTFFVAMLLWMIRAERTIPGIVWWVRGKRRLAPIPLSAPPELPRHV